MTDSKKTFAIQSVCVFLTVALVLVAIEVVGMSYQSRLVYDEIEVAYQEQLRLQTLQGQLRIEHGTWVAPAEIEGRARNEIGLRSPEASQQIALADLLPH